MAQFSSAERCSGINSGSDSGGCRAPVATLPRMSSDAGQCDCGCLWLLLAAGTACGSLRGCLYCFWLPALLQLNVFVALTLLLSLCCSHALSRTRPCASVCLLCVPTVCLLCARAFGLDPERLMECCAQRLIECGCRNQVTKTFRMQTQLQSIQNQITVNLRQLFRQHLPQPLLPLSAATEWCH